MGELVLTTIPGCTGHAHDATGLGERSTSTRHMRQLPAIMSFLLRDIVSVIVHSGTSRCGLDRRTHGSSICNMSVNIAPGTLCGRLTIPGDSDACLLASLDQGGTSWILVSGGNATTHIQQLNLPSIDTFFPSRWDQHSRTCQWQLCGREWLTNCKLNLGGSLSCRREGTTGSTGLLSAGPPGRSSQCLPQHGAVSTEGRKERRWRARWRRLKLFPSTGLRCG